MAEKTPAAASLSQAPDIQTVQQEPIHGDVALGYLKGAAPGEVDLVIDKAMTALVLRKIDWVILPILA